MLDVFLNMLFVFCKKLLSKRPKPHWSSIWLKQSWALGSLGQMSVRKPDPWDLMLGYPVGKFDSIPQGCPWCPGQGAVLSVGRRHKGTHLPFFLSSVFASTSFLFFSHRPTKPLLCSLSPLFFALLFISSGKKNASTVILVWSCYLVPLSPSPIRGWFLRAFIYS